MKKIVLMVVVMAIAAPSMAALTFTRVDNLDGSVTIGYTNDSATSGGGSSSDPDPRGIALVITLSNPSSGTPTIEPGAADTLGCPFNCYIDYMYSEAEAVLGEGDPLAETGQAGKLETGAAVVSLSFGYLDEGGTQQAVTDAVVTLVTLEVSGDAESTVDLDITADTTRGPASGVVGSEIPSVMPATLVGIVIPERGCLTAETAVFPADYYDPLRANYNYYADWLAAGTAMGMAEGEGPECWCYPFNCKGDADGHVDGGRQQYFVSTDELNTLMLAWMHPEPTAGTGIVTIVNLTGINGPIPGICADFFHDLDGGRQQYFVGTTDLNVLMNYWMDPEPTAGVGLGEQCGGQIDPSGLYYPE